SVNNPLYGREVIVSSPELLRTIFTGDPDVFLGGAANWPLRPVIGERSVLLLEGREHHRERKLLMPPFHGERLGAYGDVMRAVTERVAASWPKDKTFSLLPSMQRITFDVILHTVFGVHDDRELGELRDGLTAFADKVQSPFGMLWMLPFFQRDLGPLTGWAALERMIKANDAKVHAIIARARATPPDRRGNDILAMLLAAV